LLKHEPPRCSLNGRKIGKAHVNAGLKKARQERNRSSKPIDLGHDQGRPVNSRGCQCFFKRWSI
jgi:hypothetical protein